MKKPIFFILALAMIAPVNSFSQDDIKGFHNHNWGTGYSLMSSMLVPSSKKIKGYKIYEKNSELLKLEGVNARYITYGFKKKALTMVQIGFSAMNADTIQQIFNGKHGKSVEVKSDNTIVNKWILPHTTINYTRTFEADKVTGGVLQYDRYP